MIPTFLASLRDQFCGGKEGPVIRGLCSHHLTIIPAPLCTCGKPIPVPCGGYKCPCGLGWAVDLPTATPLAKEWSEK